MSSRNDNLMNLGITKSEIKEIKKSGIYQIHCTNCEKHDIEQTKINVGIRHNDHIRNIKK